MDNAQTITEFISRRVSVMILLESDHLNFSKVEYIIGGVTTYIYNIECLQKFVMSFEPNKDRHADININVLILIHHREGSHAHTEAFGKNILDEFSKHNSAPLIAVTFDGRNHGVRTVDNHRNSSWDEGNDSHGIDMISCIRGNDYDVKLCIDFLPSCLNLEKYLNGACKEDDVKVKYNYILSGYSVGGHSVIRIANRFPELISIINPNIGCSDLTSLLVNRLKGTANFKQKYYYFNYGELPLSEEEKLMYPESLHRTVSAEDDAIMNNFPFEKIKMFASFYTDDPLVPSKISDLWVNVYLNSNPDSVAYYEDGEVHDITPEMITKFSQWLARQIT